MVDEKVKNIIDKTFQEVDTLIEEVRQQKDGSGKPEKEKDSGADGKEGGERETESPAGSPGTAPP